MSYQTADLCDAHGDRLQVVEPLFSDFGGRERFHGPIRTVKCFEDNSLVRSTLESPGNGAVLVVDGGGSLRCALLGDMLAQLGVDNGWSGVVVYGCIRDSAAMAEMDIGVRALATHPRKSNKSGEGQSDIALHFADCDFRPRHFLYADEDGIVVSEIALPE
ncbi:MAG: ribonuclease E activity regulator RraA [Chromatiales bacterium]|nr:ribonuclease E activity regulator RraA [Chromatiales bacterium]